MTAPVGVRLHRADGTILNCELVDENGMRQWVIANAEYRPGDRITAEMIPGRTGITFAAPQGVSGADISWTDHHKRTHKTHVKVSRKRKKRR